MSLIPLKLSDVCFASEADLDGVRSRFDANALYGSTMGIPPGSSAIAVHEFPRRPMHARALSESSRAGCCTMGRTLRRRRSPLAGRAAGHGATDGGGRAAVPTGDARCGSPSPGSTAWLSRSDPRFTMSSGDGRFPGMASPVTAPSRGR